MDGYIRTLIQYRFDSFRQFNPVPTNVSIFMTAYLIALEDAGSITNEELKRGAEKIEAWVKTQKEQHK